jgi:acyl-CoA reductase-like NAD-dependent aldehyde dehydrogenase
MTSSPADLINHDLFPAPEEVPAEYRVDAGAYERLTLIDGVLRRWEGAVHDVSSPICLRRDGRAAREVIGRVPAMDAAAARQALDAAVRAWNCGRGAWPTMTVAQRIAAVEKFAARMVQSRDEVVNLLMWEIGKSLEDSRKEFDRTVEYITRTVAALREQDAANSQLLETEGTLAQVRRSPLGVCLCMGPFNYPLNETYTTLIPALIMGNTLVVKPPKFGVLAHQRLLSAFAESFPAGVVNFICGEGSATIGPILETGRVDVLAFIGSSRVADILKRQHPHPHRMRAILGLDAKNPALVLPDADLDLAVRECVAGTLSFNGQRCTALKLLFVHESIAEEFLRRFAAAVSALAVGMPWQPGVKITPLPELQKPEKLQALVADALEKGARIVNAGGATVAETIFTPAVIYPVSRDARLYTEEQFGPVVPVCVYRDPQEFLDYVSASNYGQQVSLFGRDARQLAGLIDPLANQVCRINLNTQCQRGPDELPFTGRKDSAEGTLSITDALRCFSIRSLTATRGPGETGELFRKIAASGESSFLRDASQKVSD